MSDSDEEHGSKINIMESDEDNSYDSQGSGSEIYRGSSSNRVSYLGIPNSKLRFLIKKFIDTLLGSWNGYAI